MSNPAIIEPDLTPAGMAILRRLLGAPIDDDPRDIEIATLRAAVDELADENAEHDIALEPLKNGSVDAAVMVDGDDLDKALAELELLVNGPLPAAVDEQPSQGTRALLYAHRLGQISMQVRFCRQAFEVAKKRRSDGR